MSTLIEKFKAESQSYCKKSNHKLNAPVDKWIWHGMARGLEKASEIVKQHSDWISVDERLPPVEQPVLVYNYGNTRVLPLCKTDSGLKWLDEFGQDEFDLDEIDFWQPLPQPPSEVQP